MNALTALFALFGGEGKQGGEACYNQGIMHPVIFVHGIGDSSVAWKKTGPLISKYYESSFPRPFQAGSGIVRTRYDRDFKNSSRNSCVYVTFKNHFGSPESQARELAEVIKDTLIEANTKKVDLVCHSMGGLVARKYLADHIMDHRISKVVMISTPNLGSPGLLYDEICIFSIILGLFAWIYLKAPAFLLLCLAAVAWFIISLLRGNLLLSPANFSMRPHSSFLKKLNSRPLPTDVKYAAVLSKGSDLPSRFSDLFLNIKEGDGAIPLISQKLSRFCVPNFKELDYKESLIHLPHYKEPGAKEDILKALKL